MVTLFFEIKRNLPPELGKVLKISSPDLVQTMTDIYKVTPNESIQRLIEVFFERAQTITNSKPKLAGKTKPQIINPKNSGKKENQTTTAHSHIKQVTKAPRYYRGALIEP